MQLFMWFVACCLTMVDANANNLILEFEEYVIGQVENFIKIEENILNELRNFKRHIETIHNSGENLEHPFNEFLTLKRIKFDWPYEFALSCHKQNFLEEVNKYAEKYFKENEKFLPTYTKIEQYIFEMGLKQDEENLSAVDIIEGNPILTASDCYVASTIFRTSGFKALAKTWKDAGDVLQDKNNDPFVKLLNLSLLAEELSKSVNFNKFM